jgi:bacillithiol biosynthesis deacetylase BshB1
VLKIAVRVNLGIPDGDIKRSQDNLLKVIQQIREYKPKIIFAPYNSDRHPDHQDASALIKHAMFSSGLIKIKTYKNKKKQDSFRPKKLFYYMQTYVFNPTFIVDVTETFEQKMEAVKSYNSQFFDPKSRKPETFISKPQFINYVASRAQFYGFQIGKHYGEPFFCEEKIEFDLGFLL